MSDTGKRLHCLRPLSDAPDRPPTELELKRPFAHNGSGRGERGDAISRALVGLLRSRTGRGPTKVRTTISSDLAIVTVEDFLTPTEETLVREGRGALAAQLRTALHDGMRAEAVEAIERITRRQVAAYLTAHQHDPAVAIIAFHFGP